MGKKKRVHIFLTEVVHKYLGKIQKVLKFRCRNFLSGIFSFDFFSMDFLYLSECFSIKHPFKHSRVQLCSEKYLKYCLEIEADCLKSCNTNKQILENLGFTITPVQYVMLKNEFLQPADFFSKAF